MRRLAAALVALTLVALAGYFTVASLGRAAGTNPDAMSIDMNPAGTPANTATSLGSREPCARINENDQLDADEDAVDRLDLDVTVTNIPVAGMMIGFNYDLHYNEAWLTVQTADHNFLLVANNPGDTPFDGSDLLPDSDSSGNWYSSVLDINIDSPESGSGVLSRLTVSSDADAPAGEYALTLADVVVLDVNNGTLVPDTINGGAIAVNQTCSGATPTSSPTPTSTSSPTPSPTSSPTPSPTSSPTPSSTPTPTASPTPTPTPTASPSPTPTPTPTESPTPTPTASPTPTPTATPVSTPTPTESPTPVPTASPMPTPTVTEIPTPTPTESPTPVGSATPTPVPTGQPHLQGDVDCSGAVLATDALKVLRHIAGLSVVQNEPCDNIGTGGPTLQGDVDCTGAVLATDALKILRYIAGLSVVQNPPCDNIGT